MILCILLFVSIWLTSALSLSISCHLFLFNVFASFHPRGFRCALKVPLTTLIKMTPNSVFFFLSPHQFTLFSLIGYFIYLIFKLYSLSRFTLFKYPMPSHLSCFYEGVPTPATHSCLTTIVFFYIGASSLHSMKGLPSH